MGQPRSFQRIGSMPIAVVPRQARLGVGGSESCLCEQFPDVDLDDEIAMAELSGQLWLAKDWSCRNELHTRRKVPVSCA